MAGVQAVTGKAMTVFATGEEEKEVQELKAVASEEPGELKLASSSAEFTGAAQIKLATGTKFKMDGYLTAPEPALLLQQKGVPSPLQKIIFTSSIVGGKSLKIEVLQIIDGEGTFVKHAEKKCNVLLTFGSICEVEYAFTPKIVTKYRGEFKIAYKVTGEGNETTQLGPFLNGKGTP